MSTGIAEWLRSPLLTQTFLSRAMSIYPDSETGEVVQVLPGHRARVKIPKRSNCQGCGHKNICDPFGSEHMVLTTENRLQAVQGQQVRVALTPEKQSKAIIVLYLIPLLALLIGAIVGNSLDPFGNKDLSASIFCIGCTALCFVGIWIYNKKQAERSPSSLPRIVTVLNK